MDWPKLVLAKIGWAQKHGGQKWSGQIWSNKDGPKWIGQKRSQQDHPGGGHQRGTNTLSQRTNALSPGTNALPTGTNALPPGTNAPPQERTPSSQERTADADFGQDNLGRLRFNRRGASTPLWGVEACSPPSRRPNPIPAVPPYVVRTPHLHGALTTEETVKL